MNRIRTAALSVAVGLSAAACNKVTPREADKPIFEQVYDYNGSRWPVECYGPLKTVTPKPGEILATFILDNTDIHQPVSLSRRDLPRRVIEFAVADINHLPSPDQIQANHEYQIPADCGPQD